MRVLGIDPGSVATGFGIVECREGEIVHIAHGTLRPPRSAELVGRLAFLHDALAQILESHGPEVAAIEEVFVARNPRSAVVLGQARGVALAAVGRAGLALREYAPREVKRAVVGSGSAGKAQIQDMVTRMLGLPRLPQTDAADALAIAICHANSNRLSEVGVGRGAARRRSLRSVARHLT